MSVEGGSIGSIGAVSAGPSIGPSIGSISGRGFEGRGGFSPSFVNEGPVAPAFLENTMPLTLNKFNPIGEIIFNPATSVLNQAEEVAAAAWENSEPVSVIQQAEQVAEKAWEVWKPEGRMVQFKAEPIVPSEADRIQVIRVLEATTQAGIKPEVSKKWVVNALPVTQAQARPDSQAQTWTETIQQVVEQQEVIEEEKNDQQLETSKKEQSREIRRRYVVDDKALSQIVVEVKAAVVKAKEVAVKLGIRLTGLLVDKFLPGQHPGNESEVVKGKGPDGSIPERKEAIKAHGEFSSELEAENTAVRIAYEKPPVAIRPDGQPVSTEDIYRVYKEESRIEDDPNLTNV